LEDFTNPRLLNVHRGYTDDVIGLQRRPDDVLDVFVEQLHVVFAAEGRYRGQGAGNHGAPLVARVQGQRVFEAPVRRTEARVDETDRQLSRRGAFVTKAPSRWSDTIHREPPLGVMVSLRGLIGV
jgi:hypothetical protein